MQSAIGKVGGDLGQRAGIARGQCPGVRQRQPSQHAVHFDCQPLGPLHGARIAAAGRILPLSADLIPSLVLGATEFYARGWLAGCGYFAISLWWLTEPFQVDAPNQGWMAPFAVAIVTAGMAEFASDKWG